MSIGTKFEGIARRLRDAAKRANSFMNMRHVHGPRSVPMTDDDVMVVCMVKDGEAFVTRFIEHHLALGVKHITFIDNGSTDATVDIARRYAQVTVFSNLLPVREYECIFRSQIIERMGKGHWCMVIDIDEFFHYPHSDKMSLRQLVSYLDHHGFNAVVGQMLDMFPERLPVEEGADFVEVHRYCDVPACDVYEYHDKRIEFAYFLEHNVVPSPDVKIHFGGIRAKLFGTYGCQSKHPLIRLRDGLVPVTHPHCSSHARCADFTVLLKHYRFAGGFIESARRQVEAGAWTHGENEKYLRRVGPGGTLEFMLPTSKPYESVEALLESGFLVSSKRLDEWAARS